jgi:hypothetical protein
MPIVFAALSFRVCATQDVSVRAVGRAAGADLKAKDLALQDAKRNAVLSACGEVIEAYSRAEDFALQKDRILSSAEGYLTNWKRMREWEEGGVAYCEISATVTTGMFKSDWERMFQHVLQDVGYPRLMMVIVEDNYARDGVPPIVGGIVQSVLEREFLNRNVPLVDRDTADDVRQRDQNLAQQVDDVNRMAALGAQFKAELIVTGRAEARYSDAVAIGNQEAHRWDVSLTIRAIQTDNARVILANTYRLDKPHLTTMRGASGDGALEKMATEAAPKMLRELADKWKHRVTSHTAFEVTITNCSRAEFRELFQPAIAALRGVPEGENGVRLREVAEGVVNVEIDWRFTLDDLADALESVRVEQRALRVDEQSGHRIRAGVVPAP